MQLFSVSENGALRKASRVDFAEHKVFLIDDIKTIYLWYGLKASKKKKEFSTKKANLLNRKRDNSVKIQIINQNQEFGAFLAIKDLLKKGIDPDLERRPELELQIDNTLELIDAGLEPDLEAKLTLKAYNLSQEGKSYEELCKMLAELQLSIIKDENKVLEKEIKRKTEEIRNSSSTYEELCWLIAELSKLKKKK
ncbi:MAG: hypothetical protein ACFFDN_10755 [Candidatus Hodarchaeota archaeon]